MRRATRRPATRGSPVILDSWLRTTLLAILLGAAPVRGDDASGGGGDDPGDTSGEGGGETGDEPTDELSRYRTPFPVLTERVIGTVSRPVEFDWRRTRVHLAATGDHLFELNNFNSLRAGGLVRWPGETLLWELGASWAWVWDTPSSRNLALTPYRQPGRPPRLELDFGVALPLAEGVVTVSPSLFPAVEMVFCALAGVRYLVYPSGFGGLRPGEVAKAIVSPTITEPELENLEDARLDAMTIDAARYGVMVGVADDLYFRQGLFVSPRATFALPLLAPATETDLLFWADFSIVLGMAL